MTARATRTRPRGIDALRADLAALLAIEHFVIPPYLFALYSIHEGANPDAASALRGIVREEMLHMVLAANVLNAIGGAPDLLAPGFAPRYPAPLPAIGAPEVHLRAFGRAALAGFEAIEAPRRGASIGRFLRRLTSDLRALVAAHGERAVFSGDPARQVTPHDYYGGGGEVVVVGDLPSALLALQVVIDQGEGSRAGQLDDGNAARFDEVPGLTHHHQLREVALGRRYRDGDTAASGPTGAPIVTDWSAVYPVADPPGESDEPEVAARVDGVVAEYARLLRGLHALFNGDRDGAADVVPAMFRVKYAAIELMRIPSSRDARRTVGPRFT